MRLKANQYPTKNTLNLMLVEKSSLRPSRSIPAILLVLALAVVFAKFAVIDRLSASSTAEAEAVAMETRLADTRNALATYEEVEAEYARCFSQALGVGKDVMPLTCRETLDLLDKHILHRVEVNAVSFSGNIISLQLTGSGLDEASIIIGELMAEPCVATVDVSTANAGNRTTVVGTTILMTITLQTEEAAQ